MDDSDKASRGRSLAVMGFPALCCASPFAVGTLGIGDVMAAFTSWRVLVPAVTITAGIVAWYAWQDTCRLRAVVPAPPLSGSLEEVGMTKPQNPWSRHTVVGSSSGRKA